MKYILLTLGLPLLFLVTGLLLLLSSLGWLAIKWDLAFLDYADKYLDRWETMREDRKSPRKAESVK